MKKIWSKIKKYYNNFLQFVKKLTLWIGRIVLGLLIIWLIFFLYRLFEKRPCSNSDSDQKIKTITYGTYYFEKDIWQMYSVQNQKQYYFTQKYDTTAHVQFQFERVGTGDEYWQVKTNISDSIIVSDHRIR